MKPFRPMLAAAADISDIKQPGLLSPKFDGIRCLIIDGVAMSRALKPIPNKFVQFLIGRPELNGLDGELMLFGEDSEPYDFNAIQSAVMSVDGEPDFQFCVFDDFSVPDWPFKDRLGRAGHRVNRRPTPHLDFVTHFYEPPDRMDSWLTCYLDVGYEGAMYRHPQGLYKFGRSNLRQQGLLKLKPTADEEATIIGYEPLLKNTNEASKNELGRTKRSSAKAGKVAQPLLGTFLCRFDDGAEFSCGGGLTAAQRAEFWEIRESLTGSRLTVIYQRPVGGKRAVGEAPRSPRVKAVRNPLDIS
jgi:DNA ligase-1